MKLKEAFTLLKVGMKVREVEGKGFCGQMNSTGVFEVTGIVHESRKVWFENCWHCIDSEDSEKEIEILKNPDGTPWKAKSDFPLNVGDTVKVVKDLGWDCEICSHVGWAPEMDSLIGQQFTIEKIGTLVVPSVGFGDYKFCHHWLQKVEEESLLVSGSAGGGEYLLPSDYPQTIGFSPSPNSLYPNAMYGGSTMIFRPTIKEHLSPKKGKVMSVIQSIKAKLSKTDRTLVKHGYLTEKGERTGMYEEEIWDSVRARLIADEDTQEFREELATTLNEKE